MDSNLWVQARVELIMPCMVKNEKKSKNKNKQISYDCKRRTTVYKKQHKKLKIGKTVQPKSGLLR